MPSSYQFLVSRCHVIVVEDNFQVNFSVEIIGGSFNMEGLSEGIFFNSHFLFWKCVAKTEMEMLKRMIVNE